MANVLVENATLQSIADAIRNKTGKTETMLPAEMPAEISGIETGGGYEQGYEDGKNSVVDLGKLCKNIQFASLDIFGKSEVILNLDSVTTLLDIFNIETANTLVEHITINSPKPINSLYRAFYAYAVADKTLKRITFNFDTSQCENYTNAFYSMTALETIDGTPLDFSSCTGLNQPFRNCSALKELRVKPNTIKINFGISYSPNLSTETIQSIIDGLADLTGGTAQTLDFHADIIDKLTDEQREQIIYKNWSVL